MYVVMQFLHFNSCTYVLTYILCTHRLLTDEVLGRGAFGCVYKGEYSPASKLVTEEVAVKTMEDGSSEEDRVKFLQEAAIMGQFDHPNIIKILGIVIERQHVRF